MRTLFIVIASAAALGGCANKPDASQAQAIAQAHAAADDAKCQAYGAKPGEPAYVQCRATLDNERAQMRAAVANCEATGSIFNCQTH